MKNKKKHKAANNSGFTLLEMLATIAIIGILASIIMPDLTGARASARDSERVSEVSELALALELFYNSCRDYPPTGTLNTSTTVAGCPSGVTLGDFISEVPTDPEGASYDYESGGGNFVVGATLERGGSALADNPDSPPGGLLMDCSNANLRYCKGG